MILRVVSPNKKWLIFNLAFSRGRFPDQFAEGWQFSLNPPQRINGMQPFKGINVRKVTRTLLK